ncbi:Pyrrolo-quinoline quinone [Chthoniobacter flavus Ellin428]|uniref:Pyrrolo-quinoline quinone n=1 Tax=Chthoniobacter flavus Ellin428 TaxID=497964 RepID=B4D0Q2_9BACT|nr:PQQ-binding-like beta-propeller repeat protein [Chthoniobacter flavus]EDY19914.1 Pyrrolo-quinoline quinone [Chthoniobacter flavus Ellin428]TCO91815.1 outer membrane protein assembly factor BamB [Chthoniobacter flavus]
MSPLRLFLPLLLTAATGFAANWPTWRGPQGDGVTSETNLPLKWSATENVKWKVELPEGGNSTPIIWGDRIFLTQADGQKRLLMCFDRKDGKVLWQQGPTWSETEQTHKANPPCASSPITDGERVIAWFGSAGLYAYDFAGKELWHVDLGKQDHIWGYGSSPVLSGDLCFLNFGPGPRSFVVAVNKNTGKEVWRFQVPPPDTPEGPGSGQNWTGTWSTPVIAKLDGREELIADLPGAVYSLDPATGKEIWHCNGLNPLAYAEPIVVGDVVVGFGGFNGFALGVKAGGSGDITSTNRLWQDRRTPQRVGSGVVVDGKIYLGSDPGFIQCIDPQTGKRLLDQRAPVPPQKASSWSSFVRSGDRLYLLTKSSDTLVFRADPKMEMLADNVLGDGMTNASIAVSDGEIFIRTHAHLWCIGTGK